MKAQDAFKYANDPAFWEAEKDSYSSLLKLIATMLGSSVMAWLLYIILAIAVVYVIYQVIVANNFFSGSRRPSKKQGGIILESEVPEDVDERISVAIAAGEYRQAVRYYYLKTLGLLSAGSKIQLQAKSTNDDYLRQMRDHPDSGDFRRLTRIYEYVWYGEFQPNATQFEIIRSGFNQFNQQI